ncbi:MAG: oxidoreductase [Bacteroidetes bacterium]|jgi:aryl-alcohol dehydrogenase-like predicted oxidoreductase|nr:oxidoreductase [Bacteroidota bacterium]
MNARKLGNSGIEVMPLCLGGNVFGWTINETISFDILDGFVSEGFNFIDTADVYSRWASNIGGESESIIGKWMKKNKNRNKIILATKAGMDMGQGKVDVSKKYILKAAEASLKRLQTDYIDLYQTHKDDETVPVEEALEAYAQLIKEGKVRTIGASNFSPARLNAALEASKKYNLPKYETLQPLYNLYDREIFEKELEGICIQNSISVINFYSLAAGFLSGKYRKKSDLTQSVRGAKAETYMTEKGMKILEALDKVSSKHSCTNSSVALAWLLTRKSVTAPIASATTKEQLGALVKGVFLTLDKSDLNLLDEASSW